MEAEGRWAPPEGRRAPPDEVTASRRLLAERGEPAAARRSVTMATTSRYLSEQRYVQRRPLFWDEQPESILRRAGLQEPSDQVKPVMEAGDGEVLRVEQLSWSSSRSKEDSEPRDQSTTHPWAPLRPWPTSTLLHPTSTLLQPTSTPPSGRYTRRSASRLGFGWRSKDSAGLPGDSESPHQQKYWACSIPTTPPPPPVFRHSPSWDPQRAYEALLDYTYPLRPRRGLSEGQTSTPWEDLHLQDSGIGLECVDSSTCSTSLQGLFCSTCEQGAQRSSTRSLLEAGASSSNTLDCNDDRRSWTHASSTRASTSTWLLPHSSHVCREVEEEFWALPEQLEVLQLLSTQVREATASIRTSTLLPGPDRDGAEAAEDRRFGPEVMEQGGGALAAAESLFRTPPSPTAAPRGPATAAPLTEGQGGWGGWGEGQDHSDSLMQHIQVFCCHLKLLIQQLYRLSNRMQTLPESWGDDGRGKAALDQSQSAVSSQQGVTTSVLHSGQLLLSSITSTCPELRDTLCLIERQSRDPQSLTSTRSSTQQSREDAAELLQAH